MMFLALMAQLAAAQPIKYPSWFSYDDVPVALIPEGTMRRVAVRVLIRPNGSLQGCEVELSSGDPKIDVYTCGLILKRARYSPARWSDGSPTFGVVRLPVVWSVGDVRPSLGPGDLEITENRLPKGVRSPAFVGTIFAADEQGRASSCMAEPATAGTPPSDPTLVTVACARLIAAYRAIPARDENGKPVRSVQNARVRFTEQK
jgi:hypothetical protein